MKKKFTFNIENEVMDKLKQLSKETRVPFSLYVQEAIDDLLKKYNVENKKK